MLRHSRATGVPVAPGTPAAVLARVAATAVLALAVLAASGPDAPGAELTGRVIGVRDGDTIDVLTPANERVRVRLAGIDAPEMGQAYGNVAKRALSALAHDRIARVEWSKTDDYGRVVGKVRVHGVDVNLQLVERGLAWHYKAYAGEQSAADRKRYAAAEAAARAHRAGLWRDPEPVAPWLFRHGKAVRATSHRRRVTRVTRNLAAHQTRRDRTPLG
jgi:endonuclease YncB( thermonuclease family)